MVYATADVTGERLRVGMVGGGRDAFIGAVHRMGLRLDDQAVLVAGALSSDPERAQSSGTDLGLAPDRIYSDYAEMARAESARPDGIELVAIVTPNHLHADVAKAFLNAGIDVICDKPLTTTPQDADDLVALTATTGLVFAVTLTNAGYAMVRQMREMVTGGAIGNLRGIHTAYLQDWLSLPVDADGLKQAAWRTDPAQAGPSAVLADIGVHAYHLASYVTGLTAEKVAADLSTAVPGRRLDDNANVLIRWQGDIPGTLNASQTAPGHLNDLTLHVYGDKGGLSWCSLTPEILHHTPIGGPTRILARGAAGTTPEAMATGRIPPAHPEGTIEAFGTLYRDAIQMVRARRAGTTTDRAQWLPDVVAGAQGVHFVEASVNSSQKEGRWTPVKPV